MVAARRRDHASSRDILCHQTGEGAARLEGTAVLQALQLQIDRVGCPTEIRHIHAQHGRVANIRADQSERLGDILGQQGGWGIGVYGHG